VGKPIVAIVGRQNVGKSTLLNRLARRQIAITDDTPGTTRDRVIADVEWNGRQFTLVDTGGMEPSPEPGIARAVQDQVGMAIGEADLIIFLVSASDGVTAFDREVADMLRRTRKPVLLVANKADNATLETHAVEFYELALGDPLPVSAHHGRGTGELLDRILSLLPPAEPESAPDVPRVAIVGRPGVGKSMILNSIVGGQRVIVDATPGTTRDAIDTPIDFQGQVVVLIDTAGIRRRGRMVPGIERHSVLRSLRAIDRADIALLVLDAIEPFTMQDKHVGGYVQQALKGLAIIVNKWDLVEDKNEGEWVKEVRRQFKFLPYAPVLFTSAKTGMGIDKIVPQVLGIYQARMRRLPTAAVNSVVQEALAAQPVPPVGTKRVKIKYATQAEVNPPTFVFFANDSRVHFSYRRYLENRLRQAFDFTGTPLRLVFKAGGEA
jgi:GTP-binding protein